MNIATPGGFSQRALNATTQMVEQLGKSIVAGEYPQGSLIPLDPDLEEMFGVSRTVVREAKKTLVAKGLLKSKAKVGTRVQPSTEWSMFDPDVLRWHTMIRGSGAFESELFEIRQVFEPEAAAMAARNRNEDDVDAMRRHFDGLASASTYAEYIVSDMAFHRAILRASRNRFFLALGDLVEATLFSLLDHSARSRAAARENSAFEGDVEEHAGILGAIQRGDCDEARAAMLRVITSSRSRLEDSTARRDSG